MRLKAFLLKYFISFFVVFLVMYFLAFYTIGTGVITAGSTIGLVFTIMPIASLLK